MTSVSLTQIADSHATDKGTQGPSSGWEVHNYTDIYEAYLERLRPEPIAMLEIGLGVLGDRWTSLIVHGRNTGGASMRMWYDYFPHASIYGIDINQCKQVDNDRVRTFVADQGNVADLEAFTEATAGVEFDLIIDDGSHRPDHQQVSLGYFFKRLKPGGLYFIEDLGSNGLGDEDHSRYACDTVRNTRSVLKHFLEHGEFLEPNAIPDAEYLREHIESLRFHVPRSSANVVWKKNWRRPFDLERTVRFLPESEKLCAIRKKN